MLLIIKSIIMGIVEGITEFLPISSTGHLIIVGHFIKFSDPVYRKEFVEMFEIIIQLGAILAIVVLYWEKILDSIKPKNLFNPKRYGFRLWSNMIVAMIPSLVVGLLFKKKIDEKLFGVFPVIIAMIVGGVILIIIENKYRKKATIADMDRVTYSQAFVIGCFQCLAFWPGMSRSASTIMGAWIVGLNNVAAAEFSFFLAIPTMLGATILSLRKATIILTSAEIISIGVGFVISFIVALVVVEKFIAFLKKKPMRVFAIYRICAGVLLLILALSKVISV